MQQNPRPHARPTVASVWITTAADEGRRQALPRRVPARRPRVEHPLRRQLQDEAARRRPRRLDRRRTRRAARPRPAPARAANRRTLPTLAEAAERWRESRIDVDEQTGNMHRSAFGRIFKVAPHLRSRRVDELTVDDVTALVAALADAGYKRETIRKTRTALAQTLDFYASRPEPGPRRARQAAEGTQGRTSRRRSPSTSSGSPRRSPASTCCRCS